MGFVQLRGGMPRTFLPLSGLSSLVFCGGDVECKVYMRAHKVATLSPQFLLRQLVPFLQAFVGDWPTIPGIGKKIPFRTCAG